MWYWAPGRPCSVCPGGARSGAAAAGAHGRREGKLDRRVDSNSWEGGKHIYFSALRHVGAVALGVGGFTDDVQWRAQLPPKPSSSGRSS